ncbi:MAG: DNA (cytosine-5-)-methyltransferase [Chloroflexota bacterium]|nr:DNA (cytosine-5-)-methyltransferase [Chloroflexota bacterium]
MTTRRVPVVDVFAGCGGLGEGFSLSPFELRLSIEKEHAPIKTLWLRSFVHQFAQEEVPEDYYDYLAGRIPRDELCLRHPLEAREATLRCLQAELGGEEQDRSRAKSSIRKAVGRSRDWVLIGGPPCQAYSTIGRVKNKSLDYYDPDTDIRFDLYREYLEIIGTHWPSVFVFENVKGLLSSSRRNQSVFHRMLTDLADPAQALAPDGIRLPHSHTYRLYSLSSERQSLDEEYAPRRPNDFVVKAEHYGIPQARHRIIIVGVRSDIQKRPKPLQRLNEPVRAVEVLDGLPALRSGVSTQDSPEAWVNTVKGILNHSWWQRIPERLQQRMIEVLENLEVPPSGRGSLRFLDAPSQCNYRPDWFEDERLSGTLNHETRSHRMDDLWRYLFAASFMESSTLPFRLRDFPGGLMPNHRNIYNASKSTHFADRFSVVPRDTPSRTVVSHIQKDGHYYIHYDPTQCRSLTVREAARLQTFPDNYFFEGNRTEQYSQVGNAVPPMLSTQIANRVAELFEE